ncbi:MAG: GNAT family N-acetyltransferase [Actinomycetes bacterium]
MNHGEGVLGNQDPFDIRPATASDAEAMALVHVRTWQVAYRGLIPDAHLDAIDVDERAERWRRILVDANARSQFVLVGEAHGDVVGFATGGPSRDSDGTAAKEVYAIYVHPERWDRHLGAELMESLLELLEAESAAVSLWVIGDNERARRFYAAFGFMTDGRTRIEAIGGSEVSEVRLVRPAG